MVDTFFGSKVKKATEKEVETCFFVIVWDVSAVFKNWKFGFSSEIWKSMIWRVIATV
jgi:hypothetical protein